MDILKNKQGSLIDTLIYLKAMLCSNMDYRASTCIVYYFWVSNHFTFMHLWNQGGKRTKDLCLVCYKEFKGALCNNRIRELPIYKKENWSDLRSFWTQYIMVYTPRDKCRKQYTYSSKSGRRFSNYHQHHPRLPPQSPGRIAE